MQSIQGIALLVRSPHLPAPTMSLIPVPCSLGETSPAEILSGGHFYFSPAAAALAKEIIQDVLASVGMHAPDARS